MGMVNRVDENEVSSKYLTVVVSYNNNKISKLNYNTKAIHRFDYSDSFAGIIHILSYLCGLQCDMD